MFFTLRGTAAEGEPSSPLWLPKEALLSTRWAKEVDPENAHPEYPRPHLAHEDWKDLNGVWEFAITPRGQTQLAGYHQAILVPFPPESETTPGASIPEESGRTKPPAESRNF